MGPLGRYLYIKDLMHLSESSIRPTVPIDHRLAAVQLPLNIAVWKQKLHSHPDQDFAQYVTHGTEWGFRIGIKRVFHTGPSPKNMRSGLQNKEVVDAYLQDELAKNNMLGPFTGNKAHNIHINRVGVIPKKKTPHGKVAPYITDLSFSEGNSINDMIDPALC